MAYGKKSSKGSKMTAGAGSGKGRIQKAKKAKKAKSKKSSKKMGY